MSERWKSKQIRRELEKRRAGDMSSTKVWGRYEHVPMPGEPTQASTAAAVSPETLSLRCRHDRPWRGCAECSTESRSPG
jgi:hypothetical protein